MRLLVLSFSLYLSSYNDSLEVNSMGKLEPRPQVLLVNRSIVLNDSNKFLLIQRAEDDRHLPGLWEFPGGKLEEGRDLSHALEDEVLEETGLTVLPITRVSDMHSRLLTEGPYKGLAYVCLTGISRLVGGKTTLSDEHQAYRWVSLASAYKMKITDGTRQSLAVIEGVARDLLKIEI